MGESLKLFKLTKFLRFNTQDYSYFILFPSSCEHIFRRRYLICDEILYFSGMSKEIALSYYHFFSLRHYQGVTPTISSQYITPMAKMSLFDEQGFFRSGYRAYKEEFLRFLFVLISSLLKMEKPNQQLFISYQILECWHILVSMDDPVRIIYLNRSITSIMMDLAVSSLSLPFLEIQDCRSPFLQSHVVRQVWFWECCCQNGPGRTLLELDDDGVAGSISSLLEHHVVGHGRIPEQKEQQK